MSVSSWTSSVARRLRRFERELASVAARKPSVALRRLVLDARALAELVERHWKPHREGPALVPGLGAAAEAIGLTRDVARDLRELADGVEATDSELVASKVRVAPAPLAEARGVLRELRAPLRFLLEHRGEARRAFERLERTNPRPRSAYALASALEAHAALAERHAAELARFGDVSADLPEQARRLAQALREPRRDHAAGDERRRRLRTRDALATLLMNRVRDVRAVARFVFRNHPKLVRKATSDYERKRRRKNERKRTRADQLLSSERDRRGASGPGRHG